MSKTKSTNEHANGNAQFIFGADALKTGFEKTAKLYENAGEFSKDTLEAYMESATIAGKGLQSLTSDASSYAKQSVEDVVAATKAVMSAKSFGDVIELQTGFAKSAFAGYVSQISRFNEAFMATAKTSFAPLQARVEAAAKVVQSAQA
jgi:phasin family protein